MRIASSLTPPQRSNSSARHWLRGFTPHRIMIDNESSAAINRKFRKFLQLMKR
jgi:hypothetical protein